MYMYYENTYVCIYIYIYIYICMYMYREIEREREREIIQRKNNKSRLGPRRVPVALARPARAARSEVPRETRPSSEGEF